MFCLIIDKLQTDEELEKNMPQYTIETPKIKGERSITDLANLTKDQIIKNIVELCKTYKYTTTNPKFRQFLKNNKIKHADSLTNITNMIKAANINQLKNLYASILDDENPILDNGSSPVVESKEDNDMSYVREILDEMIQKAADNVQQINPNPTTGGSLRPTEKSIHSKYFIDRHKLNNNVLELRYNKNRHLKKSSNRPWGQKYIKSNYRS